VNIPPQRPFLKLSTKVFGNASLILLSAFFHKKECRKDLDSSLVKQIEEVKTSCNPRGGSNLAPLAFSANQIQQAAERAANYIPL